MCVCKREKERERERERERLILCVREGVRKYSQPPISVGQNLAVTSAGLKILYVFDRQSIICINSEIGRERSP